VATIDRAAACRVVGVFGCAGAGTTTAVAQWVRDCAPSAHWCTVDADDSPARFWRHVLAAPALRAASAALDMHEGNGRASTLEDDISEALRSLSEPVTIVLDDIDTLTDPEVLASFDRVVVQAPPTLRIVMAGRAAPPLPGIELLAQRGEAAVVSDRDLKLNNDEANALLDELGIELPPGELATLLSRTEGWIAGFHLAGLSLRDRAGGSDCNYDDVFDYLRDEVLLRLPDRLREFMLETSVVDVLDADICRVLTERSEGADLLLELRRQNLFVEQDPTDGTFRYHTLMRELLEAELARGSAARHRELHSAAAEWYERAGNIDGAMRHWFRAGRTDRAWERFGDAMIDEFTRGAENTLQRWTELLPRHMREFDPRQALGLATALIFLGSVEEARHWTQRVEVELRAMTTVDPLVEARLTFVQFLLEFAEGNLIGAARLGTYAHQLLDAAAPSDWERLRAPLARARLFALLGHTERARETVASFVAWLDERNGWLVSDRVSVSATLAGIALAEQRWDEAASRATMALARSEHMTRRHVSIAEAKYVLGAALSRRNELEQARTTLERALTLTDRQAFVHLKVGVRIALAELHHATGNSAGAFTLLDEAHRLLPAGARVLHQRVDAAAARLSAESVPVSVDVLTDREREVWRYLATGMSMREIAGILFISRNTLKSHVRSIYQKLDVKNREEAVMLQRSRGPDDDTTRSSRS
jgi:LuxR family maltose regulon positive regulatory protein